MRNDDLVKSYGQTAQTHSQNTLDLYLNFLETILKISQKTDLQDVKEQIQDYINQQLNSTHKELYKNIQDLLIQTFKLSFKRSHAHFEFFDQPTKIMGIKKIKKYIECLQIAHQFKTNPTNTKFFTLFKLFFQLCKENRQSLFWTNENGQTFIELLILWSKGKQQNIIEFLQHFEGNLTGKVYSSMNIETVIFRILDAMVRSNSERKDKYGETILDIALRKEIDLKDGDIYGTGSYGKKIEQCGVENYQVKKAMLMMNKPIQKGDEVQYIIFNELKKGQKKMMNLGQQFNCEMKTFLTMISQKGQMTMANRNYELKVQITEGKFIASIKQNDQTYSGILVPVIQPFLEEYEWEIFDQINWMKVQLKEQRKNELLKHSKNKKGQFELLLTEMDLKLEIDLKKFKVNKVCQNTNETEPFGIIYWKPIHNLSDLKNDRPSEKETHDEEDDVDDITMEPLFKPVEKGKQLVQLDNESKEYPFLAILADHIPSSCIYRINREERYVKAFDQTSIRKINRWLEQVEILFLEAFTGESTNSKQIKQELKKNDVLEKVRDKIVEFLPFNFQKNIILSKGVLKVVEINRNEDFVKDFIKYLIEIELENLSKQKYTIEVPPQHVEDVKTIIEAFDDSQIQMKTSSKLVDFGKTKKSNQIELKANPQKIAALVEAVNDQNPITFDSPNIAGLLNYQQAEPKEYVNSTQNLTLTEEKDHFKIKGKKIPVFAFWAKFSKFLQKVQQEKFQQEKVTLKFPGEGPHFKLFQSIVEDLPDAQIHLKGKDIQVETFRRNMTKYEAHIKSKLKDVKFEIIEKSKTQFWLKNIEDKYSRCLEKVLRTKITQLKQANNSNIGHIECELSNTDHTTYKFILNRGNQSEIQAFHKIGINFKMRYFEYKNELYQLRRTNQIEKNALNPLREIKLTSKQETQTLLKLTRKYKQKVHKLIEEIFEEKKILLEKDFYDFLLTKPIDQKYTCLKNIDIQQTLEGQNDGIFYEYLEELIEQKSKNLPLRKEEFEKRKKFIMNRVQHQALALDEDLRYKNLQNENVRRVMMAMKVLVASYFTTNLPIVYHLEDFGAYLQKYDNIIVKVGTGSGKSTILPPFLIGMGYKRVVVTQPRRLPCVMIYKRIKSTHSADLVGYTFAGAQQSPQNPLQYMTDGYLKFQLDFHLEIVKDIDVLILDQIHERSKNIDLILAKIGEARKINPKLKVILCSATVDENIIKIIDNSNNYGVFNVEIKRHQVKEFKIQNQSILEKANDLSAKLKKNEKMLIFFPGIDEVMQAVTTFKEKYKKLAFPLHGAQRNSQQDEVIESGQIFIATSIAETSLTFQNLKYVLDSRKARYVTFNEQLGTYVTIQKIASKSSATQRKGRVGRDCPGEYYQFQNLQTGRMIQDDFDMTELDRIDLTNVVFELLIKQKDISKVRQILERLMNNSASFKRKFDYSLALLKQLRIIDDKEKLKTTRDTTQILSYGNLGDIRFNIALTKGNQIGCSEEIAIIVSFLMYGSKIIEAVLSSIPSNKHHPSGDIMTICTWMSKMCENLKLKSLSLKDIYTEACKYPQLNQKPYFSTIIRVLKQIKSFFYKIPNSQSCLDWDEISKCLIQKAFKNEIYFHEGNLGGQKGCYSKLIENTKYISNKNKFDEIHYKINQKSLIYKSNPEQLPSVIISLSNFCNTIEDSTLSFCSLMSKECQRNIQYTYESSQQLIPYNIPTINEKEFLKNQIGGTYANNKYSYKAAFNTLSQWYKNFGNTIFNKVTEIDLSTLLEQQIKAKHIDEGKAKILKEQYEKINFYDIFAPLKFEFENLYDVKMKIPFNSKKKLVISNASNYLLRAIVKRIKCFFTWFVMCQNICQEDKKVDPQLIHKKRIDQTVAEGIQKRINMIVDSSIEYHIVKSWAQSQTNQYSSRTMRMVAVCWILTNKFQCSVKGGFIRDWVVRNHESLPKKDLRTILGKSPLNGHFQVIDDTVCPVDIDADLPGGKFFDVRKFYQEMLKLNIQMQVSNPEECTNGPDYWRIHIVFDKDSPTGPFTADLIQPYCTIAHDKCDFDVNLFYLKKDWKGAIGLKIPLEIRPVVCDNNQNDIKYTLEELLKNCIDKKMKQINAQVGTWRRKKFEARGWTVDPIIYEPTIYKSKKTTSYKMEIEEFKRTFPQFMQKMPDAKIYEVHQLKNSNWDQCYDSVRQWIINDGERTNENFLFHGSKEKGITGIYEGGFDSRYFAKDGYYGRGAYFADDSSKSQQYVEKCPKYNNMNCMFVCKVALGKQEPCTNAANGKLGPSPGYHSILGTAGSHKQYIIDRFGQAKPMFLVKYL